MADDDKWMTGPTRAQKDTAASLGLTIPPRCGRARLARLIKQAQANLAPSAEQIDLAQYFDVAITDGMTSGELDRKLVPIVRQHAIAAMRANPVLRAGKIIWFEGLPHEITFIGGLNGRYVADLKSLDKTGDQNVRQVLIKDIPFAREIERDVALAMLMPVA